MLSALRMLSKLSTYLRRQHHKNVKKGTIRIERKFAEDWSYYCEERGCRLQRGI